MNYGVNASGSNTYKMLSPLESVFGYKYVAFYDRSYYSPRQWRELLQYELRRGVPLVYAGYNMNFSGHAFVVDGLDENGFYQCPIENKDGETPIKWAKVRVNAKTGNREVVGVIKRLSVV